MSGIGPRVNDFVSRRIIYVELAHARQAMNREALVEPTESEPQFH
jgi:hypothetical protein